MIFKLLQLFIILLGMIFSQGACSFSKDLKDKSNSLFKSKSTQAKRYKSILAKTHRNNKLFKHVKHKYWTNKYDRFFKKYTKHYFGPLFSWRWFKAQAIAESNLRDKAKSRVGALGIMQIMPTTYADIVKKNPHIGDIFEPNWNIAAGIFYDRQIYKRWQKKKVPSDERLYFTFASYNAGHTKILRAFNKTSKKAISPEGTQEWQIVKKYTPKATRAYVHRIKSLMLY